MADVSKKRRTRLAEKRLNDSLKLYYDIENEFPEAAPEKKLKSNRTKASVNPLAGLKRSPKIPNFEYFSDKMGKCRKKSDSGIFMTPPVLQDITNISLNVTKENNKGFKIPNKISKNMNRSTSSPNSVSKVAVVAKSPNSSILKGTLSKRKNVDKRSVSFVADDNNKTYEYEGHETPQNSIVKSEGPENFFKNAVKRINNQESNQDASKKRDFTKQDKKSKKSDLKKGVGIQPQRQSIRNFQAKALLKQPRVTRQNLQQRIQEKASTKFSIQSLVEKFNKEETRKIREGIKAAPTSTPIDSKRKRNNHELNRESIELLSPPKVSPVYRVLNERGEIHGEIVSSPSSTTNFSSPPLKRVTRRSVQESESSKCNTDASKQSTMTDKIEKRAQRKRATSKKDQPNAKNKESMKLKPKATGNKKLVKDNTGSDGIEKENKKNPSKSKSKTKTVLNKAAERSDSDSSQVSADNEVKEADPGRKLSIHLFEEFSPVKPKISKKMKSELALSNIDAVTEVKNDKPHKKETSGKLVVKKISPDTSILDISKSYVSSPYSKTAVEIKKSKGRYSTSKLEDWAQKKNEEFEDIDSYELSME